MGALWEVAGFIYICFCRGSFVKWRAKLMVMFRRQAQDSRVKICISPQQNIFGHLYRDKKKYNRICMLSGCEPRSRINKSSVNISATDCCSSSLHENCFHMWHCVSTCRHMIHSHVQRIAFTARFTFCCELWRHHFFKRRPVLATIVLASLPKVSALASISL